MQTLTIGNTTVPVLGMGTWRLGETPSQRQNEIDALRYGLDHGLTVLDTAEIYGEGASETLVGEAINQYARDQVYLVSKFAPWHASSTAIKTALEGSLKRLGVDYLDLYLYHWRGETPLAESFATLQALKQEGLIRAYGVSNFSAADLAETAAVPGGEAVVADELYYNFDKRSLEYSLKPDLIKKGITTIGYSPFGSGDGGRITLPQSLVDLAHDKGLTPHQLMLAWTLRDGDVLSIPKASTVAHMKANMAVIGTTFSQDELRLIDQTYPRPTADSPFEMM